jgi:DNA invertase Pin-like site-specific DNA recombinase
MKVDLSKPRKVAFYCRVAREDDEAIGKQADILRVYAKEHGYDDRALYVDNGVSGIGFDRPAFNRLERHIGDGRIGTVMVTDLSRVSRNPFEMSDWINGIRRRGIKFISVRDNITDEIFEQKDVYFQRLCEYFEKQEPKPMQ